MWRKGHPDVQRSCHLTKGSSGKLFTPLLEGEMSSNHSGTFPGTNINGALQTGAKLLNDYIAQNDIDARSVSLIIFLTDGRPTVGETQSSKILSNTKDAIRDKFCLFTIGIGNDVDHKLLERMALENCGMTRLFQEDEDAAGHLKGFVLLFLFFGFSGKAFWDGKSFNEIWQEIGVSLRLSSGWQRQSMIRHSEWLPRNFLLLSRPPELYWSFPAPQNKAFVSLTQIVVLDM